MDLALIQRVAVKHQTIDEDINASLPNTVEPFATFVKTATRAQTNHPALAMQKMSVADVKKLERQIRSLPAYVWNQILNHEIGDPNTDMRCYRVGVFTIFFILKPRQSGIVVGHKIPITALFPKTMG